MNTAKEKLEQIAIKEGYLSWNQLLRELDLSPSDITTIVCMTMEDFANSKLDEAIKIASDISLPREDVGCKIQMLKFLK